MDFNKNNGKLSCKDANRLDMVQYLARIGISPKKNIGNDCWFLSPFREERTPSFKVDSKNNVWYDFGAGHGGTLVDFGIQYYKCTVGEFLNKLDGGLTTYHHQIDPIQQREKKINVTAVSDITHPALINYLSQRHIPLSIATRFCKEVNFDLLGKGNFGIGFQNLSGGYELRNKFFKGSSSPKDYTHIQNGYEKIKVIEGFIDFLSFLTLYPDAKSDFLILNSLSFFERAKIVMENYPSVQLYLDGDKAGQNCSRDAIASNPIYEDKSSCFKGYEDLNDFLCKSRQTTKVAPKQKSRKLGL